MPIYTFINKNTNKEFDEMMTISEMESYLNKNKHINQVIKGLTPPMPSFEMEPQSMADLLSYLHSLKN